MRLMFGMQPTSPTAASSADKKAQLRRSLTLQTDEIKPDLKGPSTADREEVQAGQRLNGELTNERVAEELQEAKRKQAEASGIGKNVDTQV